MIKWSYILLGFLSILAVPAYAKHPTIRVAVIDTGLGTFGQDPYKMVKLCPEGHEDFTKSSDFRKIPVDRHGHGTNVSGLIHSQARFADYCQIILKYWDPVYSTENLGTIQPLLRAIRKAIELKVDIINMSFGDYSYWEPEEALVKEALDRGITIVAAAGNGQLIKTDRGVQFVQVDLGADCSFYPACADPRVVVVGSKGENEKLSAFSNFGKPVDAYDYGENRVAFNVIMSGTSQATGSFTGRIILKAHKLNTK